MKKQNDIIHNVHLGEKQHSILQWSAGDFDKSEEKQKKGDQKNDASATEGKNQASDTNTQKSQKAETKEKATKTKDDAAKQDLSQKSTPKKPNNPMQKYLPYILIGVAFLLPLTLFMMQISSDSGESGNLQDAITQSTQNKQNIQNTAPGNVAQVSYSEEATTHPIVIFIGFIAIAALILIFVWFNFYSSKDKTSKKEGKQMLIGGIVGLVLTAFFFVITSIALNQAELSRDNEPKREIIRSNLSIEPRQGIGPLKVQLDASPVAPGAQYYSWNFGDGSEATGKKVHHTYDQIGRFLVTLTVTYPDNTTQTVKDMVIVPNLKPEVLAVASSLEGYAPLEVEFDASQSSDPNGQIIAYSWDFGNPESGTQNMASGAKVRHTYQKPGTYTAQVQVVDNNQDIAIKSFEIKVTNKQNPIAVIDSFPKTLSGMAPFDVRFSGAPSQAPSGNIVSYSWDLGKNHGKENGRVVEHSYKEPGVYTVKLVVTDQSGNNGTAQSKIYIQEWELRPKASIRIQNEARSYTAPALINISAEESKDPDGNIVNYEWRFGDDSKKAYGEKITHTYKEAGYYTIELTITDNDGYKTKTSQNIEILSPREQPPVAELQTNPVNPSIVVGDQIAFDASASDDKDGEIISYHWEFGDGSAPIMGTTQVQHRYNQEGVYEAKLTVRDNDNQTDTIAQTISVRNSGPNADIVASRTSGLAPLEVDVHGMESMGDLVRYGWDFDDGYTVANEVDPKPHVFTSPGIYNVELTVSDVQGREHTDSVRIVVGNPEDFEEGTR